MNYPTEQNRMDGEMETTSRIEFPFSPTKHLHGCILYCMDIKLYSPAAPAGLDTNMKDINSSLLIASENNGFNTDI